MLAVGVDEPQAASTPTAPTSTVETRTRRIATQGTRNPRCTRVMYRREVLVRLQRGREEIACRPATRSAMVAMFQRSGRRSGSSSSSHVIGVETGAPGAGRSEYGAASVLLMMFCV